MARRMTAAVLLGVVLTLLLSACGRQGCSTIESVSTIRIQVPAPIRKLAHTLSVDLCQGDHCASVASAGKPESPDGQISPGITLEGDAYVLDVTRFGTGWKAERPSRLTIVGSTRKGRAVFRHVERFEFDGFYPNGPDCDRAPTLRHSTAVDGGDLVG